MVACSNNLSGETPLLLRPLQQSYSHSYVAELGNFSTAMAKQFPDSNAVPVSFSRELPHIAFTFFNAFDPAEPVGNVTGNLPHWRQRGATYFVTFRTADWTTLSFFDRAVLEIVHFS